MMKTVLTLMMVFLLAGLAGADIYTSNGFEDPPFTLGEVKDQDGWTIHTSTTNSADVRIQDTMVANGSQALELNPYNDTADQRAIGRKDIATSEDLNEFYVSFSAFVPQASQNPVDHTIADDPYLWIRNNSGDSFYYLKFAYDTGNGASYLNPDGDAGVLGYPSYSRDVWNDIVIRLELPHAGNGNSGSYDLWLNGSLLTTTPGTLDDPDAASGKDGKRFDFDWTAEAGKDGSLYIDDFRVYVPEPVSMTTLLCGGVAMLLKRKRK